MSRWSAQELASLAAGASEMDVLVARNAAAKRDAAGEFVAAVLAAERAPRRRPGSGLAAMTTAQWSLLDEYESFQARCERRYGAFAPRMMARWAGHAA